MVGYYEGGEATHPHDAMGEGGREEGRFQRRNNVTLIIQGWFLWGVPPRTGESSEYIQDKKDVSENITPAIFIIVPP